MGQLQTKFIPCRWPVTYSLGSIDKRFGISTSTLIADLQDAEDIWEISSGKELFEYKARGGSVVVNLVYDRRQAATDKLAVSGAEVDKNMAAYESQKAQYKSMAVVIASKRTQLQQSIASYQSHQDLYNAEVRKWNRQGGAPPAEYARLQEEKAALGGELKSVEAQQVAFSADVDRLNALGSSLNQLIEQLNLNVDTYNEVGASIGAFEEGEFVSRAGEQRIDIWEYSSHNELVRLAAHEMGHSLGLEHVQDQEAIMYKVNQGKDLAVTVDDIQELDRVCASGIF